ncbi:uncharacterized protein VTP21DRAFT_4749 [Calcarisporiella thermophila]|uniref:uncharacterized protein n=1 Tax=Calcarisporiella thermophila TaxID=911321 RepID=UPI00374422DC
MKFFNLITICLLPIIFPPSYAQSGGLPAFPPEVRSCVECKPFYSQFTTCLQKTKVLDNFSTTIANPLQATDAIKCLCSPDHKPCLDCLTETKQFQNALGRSPPDGVVGFCKVMSGMMAGVTKLFGQEKSPQTSAASILPTQSNMMPTSISNFTNAPSSASLSTYSETSPTATRSVTQLPTSTASTWRAKSHRKNVIAIIYLAFLVVGSSVLVLF